MYSIVGVLRICDYQPAFGLAILAREGHSGFWLQVIEPGTERISGFTQLAVDDAEDVEAIPPVEVSVGDNYVHAFINWNGELYLDRADNLQTFLKIAVGLKSTTSAMKLSFSEHIEDRASINEVRRNVIDGFSQAFGKRPGELFANTLATSQLWIILERASVGPDALKRIRRARSLLRAVFSPDNELEIDLDAIDPSDLRIGYEEVENQIRREFGAPESSPEMPVADLVGLPSSDEPTIITIMEAVKRSPRQEERLAILLRSLILYPSPAREALMHYDDKAQMARGAIDLLRYYSSHNFLGVDALDREIRVAQLIPRFVSDAYPMRRGEMIYYLAVHLRDFKIVAGNIREVLSRSHAREVDIIRDQIIHILDELES